MYCYIFVTVVVLYTGVSVNGNEIPFAQSGDAKKIRWADWYEEDDMEPTCDRLVVMVKYMGAKTHLGTYAFLAPGIIFGSDRILTSFNPFRRPMKDSGDKGHSNRYMPTVMMLSERQFTEKYESAEYKLIHRHIICGREVIPIVNKRPAWLGKQKEFSPIHDIMVFRLYRNVTLKGQSMNFDMRKQPVKVFKGHGPVNTAIARPGDILGRAVLLCSLGFRDKEEIKKYAHFHSAKFEEENVWENCDEWLPREWGYFICIRNVNNYKGLGSGAMLFSNNKVFGVGSFMLSKGKRSILVFTDVRRYHHIIYNTCNEQDQLAHLHMCHPGLNLRI